MTSRRRADITMVLTLGTASFLLGLLLWARLAHAGTGPSSQAEFAFDAWSAWRAGWIGIGVTFALLIGGAVLISKRGYIVRRWPRLDIGRAWALLAIGVGALVTMAPLAIEGALGIDAIRWALADHSKIAIGLWVTADMTTVRRKADEKRAATNPDSEVPT